MIKEHLLAEVIDYYEKQAGPFEPSKCESLK